MPDYRNATTRYIAHGWPIFPCRVKAPLTPHGFQDASTDPAQIAEWWTRWPEANIAVATGNQAGVFVIDIDHIDAHGVDGYAAWDTLCDAHNWREESDTLMVLTPSGGVHLYFNYVDGITNARGTLPRGLDVRGQGGYVLLPPSVIDVRPYKWLYTKSAVAMDAPQWLIEILTPRVISANRTDVPPDTQPHAEHGPSVIESYNESTDIHDQLRHYGYTILPGEKFVRPGKSPKDGISGTIKNNRAYTFSANDPGYDANDVSPSGAGCTLRPFDLLARLSFNGDTKAAVKYLLEARR